MPPDNQNCAICLSPIDPAEASTACPACHAVYHAECWNENGGCAAYGCTQVPTVEKRAAIEIPVSYWGRENKQCPNCGQEILAAAVRCRHCGTTFGSAQPQAAEEFQRKKTVSEKLPETRRTIIILFVFSILTCLAPVGAVWGLIWHSSHREEIRALPAIYGALAKIGLGVALAQTIGLVLLTLIYTLVHH